MRRFKIYWTENTPLPAFQLWNVTKINIFGTFTGRTSSSPLFVCFFPDRYNNLFIANLYVKFVTEHMCGYVCVLAHRAVTQVSHGARIAQKLPKHVRGRLLPALKHSHGLVTAAEEQRHEHVLKHQLYTHAKPRHLCNNSQDIQISGHFCGLRNPVHLNLLRMEIDRNCNLWNSYLFLKWQYEFNIQRYFQIKF